MEMLLETNVAFFNHAKWMARKLRVSQCYRFPGKEWEMVFCQTSVSD